MANSHREWLTDHKADKDPLVERVWTAKKKNLERRLVRSVEQELQVQQQLHEVKLQLAELDLADLREKLRKRKLQSDRMVEQRVKRLKKSQPSSQTTKEGFSMIFFHASYCAPCREMLPVISKLADEGIGIRKVDITTDPNTCREFKIDRIPTIVIMKDGREVDRHSGLLGSDEARALLTNDTEKN